MKYMYHEVFAVDDMELGVTDITQHHIDTGSHPPIKHVRRVPHALRDKMATLVKDMLDRGVVQHSKSPKSYSSYRIVFVLILK